MLLATRNFMLFVLFILNFFWRKQHELGGGYGLRSMLFMFFPGNYVDRLRKTENRKQITDNGEHRNAGVAVAYEAGWRRIRGRKELIGSVHGYQYRIYVLFCQVNGRAGSRAGP